MSSDNYILVRKVPGGGFLVTDESASVDRPWSVRTCLARGYGVLFRTLDEASTYAHSQYSEYGVSYGFRTKVVEE